MTMTLDDSNNNTPSPTPDLNATFEVIDFSTPQREKPMVHPAVDPPICVNCLKQDLQLFNPECTECQEMLCQANTTIPEILAVLRQWTPATQQHLEQLIREVLRRGAHVDDRDSLTDMTLLHYAARAGAQGIGDAEEACRMVNLLMSKGANPYMRSRWTNMTALHYASYFDVSSVIKVLMKHTKGVDVDSVCSEFDDGTPLHIVAANLGVNSARVLVENSANTNARDRHGRTPLECVPSLGRFLPDSEMGKLVLQMQQVLEEAESIVKATTQLEEAENSEDALIALGISLGEKVVVGGVKCGWLRYCGPAQFAPGMWAGIELDDAAGKNDGSVGGMSYFTCPPKYGIFAPLSKIAPAGSISPSQRPMSAPQRAVPVSHPRVNTSKVTARVDTGLNRSRGSNSPPEELALEERVIVAGQRHGVIRFHGETKFAPGLWYGIELDKPAGKNDGSVSGVQYFTCKTQHGVFAPLSRLSREGDLEESTESPEDQNLNDRQRKLSAGSSGSQQNGTAGANVRRSAVARSKNSSAPVGMRRSYSAGSGPDFRLTEGMSVFCNNELGVLRYIGPVDFSDGVWLGVELRTPKGRNDGSVQGRRYFSCRQQHGLIVRPSKVTVRGINGAKLLADHHLALATASTEAHHS